MRTVSRPECYCWVLASFIALCHALVSIAFAVCSFCAFWPLKPPCQRTANVLEASCQQQLQEEARRPLAPCPVARLQQGVGLSTTLPSCPQHPSAAPSSAGLGWLWAARLGPEEGVPPSVGQSCLLADGLWPGWLCCRWPARSDSLALVARNCLLTWIHRPPFCSEGRARATFYPCLLLVLWLVL